MCKGGCIPTTESGTISTESTKHSKKSISVAVRIDDIFALVEVKDEELLPYFQDEVPIHFTPRFVTQNK